MVFFFCFQCMNIDKKHNDLPENTTSCPQNTSRLKLFFSLPSLILHAANHFPNTSFCNKKRKQKNPTRLPKPFWGQIWTEKPGPKAGAVVGAARGPDDENKLRTPPFPVSSERSRWPCFFCSFVIVLGLFVCFYVPLVCILIWHLFSLCLCSREVCCCLQPPTCCRHVRAVVETSFGPPDQRKTRGGEACPQQKADVQTRFLASEA